jgi:serine/threonine-protein kinase
MLSGQRPVIGDDPRAIALKVERGELKSLVHLAPEVPPPLAGLVHRAMAARPEMRFQTATEMRSAIEASLARIESDPALSATAALEGPHPATYRPATGTIGLAPRQPSTLRGTPVDHAFGHAPAMAPPTEPEPELEPESLPEPHGVPRRSGMGVGVLLLAVLLGVGVVVALAMAQKPKNAADPAPSQTTPIGSLAAVTVTTGTDDGASLRPLASSPSLHPTGGPSPSAKPTVSTRPTASTPPHAPDASTTTSPLPLPSVLPNPLPSTIPPLPTAFPSSFSTTFTLPGFGPPPQSPPP